MILLDYKDRRPIYEQIVDRMETMILRGVWETGSQLPSVRSLAMELSINPNTIQRAYGELERQGYIYSVKGKGSFVSDGGDWKRQKREELETRLREDVELGRSLEIGAEEMTALIGRYFKEGGKA